MTPIRPCYFCAFRPATVVTPCGDACASCVHEHGILPTTIEDEPEEVTPTIPPATERVTLGLAVDDEWYDEYMTGILAVPQ